MLNSDHYHHLPPMNHSPPHMVKSHRPEEMGYAPSDSSSLSYNGGNYSLGLHYYQDEFHHQLDPNLQFKEHNQFSHHTHLPHHVHDSGNHAHIEQGRITHDEEQNFQIDHYIHPEHYHPSNVHNEQAFPGLGFSPSVQQLGHFGIFDSPIIGFPHNNQSAHSTPCNFGEGFPSSSPWLEQEPRFETFTVKSEATICDLHPCQWENCREAFRGMEEMIRHVVECHIGSGRSTYECRWRGCKRACKPFPKRHKMLNHFRTHTGEKPFICQFPNCKKAFSRPDSLATHVKTHSDVRPYTCPLPDCGRSYYHSRSLRKHLIAHSSRPTPYIGLLTAALHKGIKNGKALEEPILSTISVPSS